MSTQRYRGYLINVQSSLVPGYSYRTLITSGDGSRSQQREADLASASPFLSRVTAEDDAFSCAPGLDRSASRRLEMALKQPGCKRNTQEHAP